MQLKHKLCIVPPADVNFVGATSSMLEFTAAHGERLDVTVLEEDLVRVRMRPQGQARLERTWLVLDKDGFMPREGRSREDLSPFSLPAARQEQREGSVILTTSKLKLDIHSGDFAIQWSTESGIPLAADLPGRAYAYDFDGQQVYHTLLCRPGERYFGFGEVSGKLNKAGRRVRLKNTDALGYSAKFGSPLYKHFPFYITFQPETQQAFGLFYDNLASTTFDLNHRAVPTHAPYRSYAAEGGDVDYYFIYGPSIREVVEKFTRLTGRMLLPPRWSLGYLGSTMKYTESRDAQRQLEKFAQNCRVHQIPCDLFHLSSGYTLGEDGKRYVFHWNRKRIPDPQGMVDDFHKNGIRLAANIKPALLTTHPSFAEVKALGGFIRAAAADEPQLLHFWGGTAAALDFTNPVTNDWWKQQIKAQLLSYGIDSTWNDNNEYELPMAPPAAMALASPFPLDWCGPCKPC